MVRRIGKATAKADYAPEWSPSVHRNNILAANVRFGSKADIQGVEPMSAITPKATAKADIAMGYERDPKLG